MHPLVTFLASEVAKEVIKPNVIPLFKDDVAARDRAVLKDGVGRLNEGQRKLKGKLSDVYRAVVLKESLDKMFAHVDWMTTVIASGRPPSAESLTAMQAFVRPEGGPGSAHDWADLLSQKFFGSKCLTPRTVWDVDAEDLSWPGLGDDGLVAERSEALFDNHERVVSLDHYVTAMLKLDAEVLDYFDYLGQAMKIVHAYLGQRDISVAAYNPRVYEVEGLAGLLSAEVMTYVFSTCPAAFELHHSLFTDRTPRQVGIITRFYERVLECDDGPGRAPAVIVDRKQQQGFHLGDVVNMRTYAVAKTVYADQKTLERRNPNHWWYVCPATGDATACTVRTARNGHYLGVLMTLGTEEIGVRRDETISTAAGLSDDEKARVGAGRRCHWELHLTRRAAPATRSKAKDEKREKGPEPTYFVLENLHSHTCLFVDGQPSARNRQVYPRGPADDHADKSLTLTFPTACIPMGSYAKSCSDVRVTLSALCPVPGTNRTQRSELELVEDKVGDIVVKDGRLAYSDDVVSVETAGDYTKLRDRSRLGVYVPPGKYLKSVSAIKLTLSATCTKADSTKRDAVLDITRLARFQVVHNDDGTLRAE